MAKYISLTGLATFLAGVKSWANGIFAKVNGYYSTLTAGTAENLVGRGAVSAEFTARTTGGTADVGTGAAILKKIKGNTVVWNQKVQNGNFAENANWALNNPGYTSLSIANNEAVLSYDVQMNYDIAIVQSLSRIPSGHKLLISETIKLETSGTIPIDFKGWFSGGGTVKFDTHQVNPNVWSTMRFMLTLSNYATSVYFGKVGNISSFTVGDKIHYKNLSVIDLTQMFGAGNEPSTVAEFEAMFPLDYYAYNAGDLLSLNATGIKTEGFNQYNPTTGKADVIKGNAYQITGTYTSLSLNGETVTPDASGVFTPSADGELTVTGGNATDTCVHLVWSGIRNGEYEQHWAETASLPVTTATGKVNGQGASEVIFPEGMKSAGAAYDELVTDIDGYARRAIKRTQKRAHQSGDESDTTVITDGTNTIAPLATPIEYTLDTPIFMGYREDDFGTERLMPLNTATPATTPLMAEIQYPMNAVDTLRNLPKNYAGIAATGTASTIGNLLAALQSAGVIAGYTITYDATNGRYSFTITPVATE